MIEVTEDQIEQIGQLAETADNLVAASLLPMPATFHLPQLQAGLRSLVKDLRALVVALGGDEWEMPPS